MKQQLRHRRELLRSGKKPLGWKLAFGGPAAFINEPLAGFLMADAVLTSRSNVSLDGWKKPAAEPEIAVYMGKDLAARADRKGPAKQSQVWEQRLNSPTWIIPQKM